MAGHGAGLSFGMHGTVDLACLVRVTAPLIAAGRGQQEDEQQEDSIDQYHRVWVTCSKLNQALKQAGLRAVVLSTAPDRSVVCAHKTLATRVFKLLYTNQASLGIKLTTDIKAAVNLKPMCGVELQMALSGGAAAALEAAGWQYLCNGQWLRQDSILSLEPGTVQKVAFIRLALLLAGGVQTSPPGIRLHQAATARFTPFSVVQHLGLTPSQPNHTELEVLAEQVFSSRAEERKACRLLYNTVCYLLPDLIPVLIKGVKQVSGDEQQLRQRWACRAPCLPLAHTLPPVILEVSQDPDADSGECGVWEVPAACCWAAPGLSLPPPGPPDQQVVQQVLDALKAPTCFLCGDKPLQLAPLHLPATAKTHTPAPPQLHTAAVTQHVSAASRPELHVKHMSDAGNSRVRQSGDPPPCTSWLPASHTQLDVCQPPASRQQYNPGTSRAVAPAGAGASTAPSADKAGSQQGGAAGQGQQGWVSLLLPGSAHWWCRCGQGGPEEAGGDVTGYAAQAMSCDDHDEAAADPEAQVARRAKRAAESQCWLQLQPTLSKLQQADADDADVEPAVSTRPTQAAACRPGTAPITAGQPPGRPVLLGRRALTPATTTTGATGAGRSTATGQPGKTTNKKTVAAVKGVPRAVPATKKSKVEPAVQGSAGTAAVPAVGGHEVPAAHQTAAAGAQADVVTGAPVAAAAAAAALAPAPAAAAAAATVAAAAAAPARKRKAADVDLAAVEAKVVAKAGLGQLNSLSIPEMQAWLRARKLPVSGRKAELEARMMTALGLTPQAAAHPAPQVAPG